MNSAAEPVAKAEWDKRVELRGAKPGPKPRWRFNAGTRLEV